MFSFSPLISQSYSWKTKSDIITVSINVGNLVWICVHILIVMWGTEVSIRTRRRGGLPTPLIIYDSLTDRPVTARMWSGAACGALVCRSFINNNNDNDNNNPLLQRDQQFQHCDACQTQLLIILHFFNWIIASWRLDYRACVLVGAQSSSW